MSPLNLEPDLELNSDVDKVWKIVFLVFLSPVLLMS